jgi:hypothetical protein
MSQKPVGGPGEIGYFRNPLRPNLFDEGPDFESDRRAMCNLYSITKRPQAIRDFARALRDRTGNLPPIPGVFRADRAQRRGWRTRAYNGPLGHAVAEVRHRGP